MKLDKHALGLITVALLEEDLEEDAHATWTPKKERRSHSQRVVRRYVNSIFQELGPYYVRRAYQMHAPSFWKLLKLLDPYLNSQSMHKQKTRKGGGAKNGIISNATRLSCAIRYFAGGRPEDIGIAHGVSHCQVFRSAWRIVDAVLATEALDISFPVDHREQRRIAAEFKACSKAGFDCCAGPIDGMLVWVECPSLECCEIAQCGRKKFFCARKNKFGVGFQGVCNAHSRFLDVSIGHPATTSNYLGFTTSSIYYKVQQKGFLANGLCLFGDSAYVNTEYMATPFKNVSSGPKDDCNFYHSQVIYGQLARQFCCQRLVLLIIIAVLTVHYH